MPKLNTTKIWTPIFEWSWSCESKNWHQPKRHHVFLWDWTTWSIYANHSRLNSQHDWRNLCGHLMSTRIFSVIGYSYKLQELWGKFLWVRFEFTNPLALVAFTCLSIHLWHVYLKHVNAEGYATCRWTCGDMRCGHATCCVVGETWTNMWIIYPCPCE